VPLLVGANAEAYRRVQEAGWEGLHDLLVTLRAGLLADPLGGFRDAMAGAPDADRAVMEDPAWQEAFVDGVTEALRPGAEGWADEAAAMLGGWDVEPSAVRLPVVWWHGRHDANAPLPAVERYVAQLPSCELRVWESAGHLETYHREPEILADLLAR
jgi:pimeloyl-ACP methyl ester carboxylesterase